MRPVAGASRPFLVVVTCCAVGLGCGGTSAPPTAPTNQGAPSPAPADGESTAVGESAPEDEMAPASDSRPAIPRARIVGVREVAGIPGDRRVKIEFENPTPSSCRFTSYTMVWPGGRKTIEEKPFDIPPGGKRLRSLRMHANDGDLSSLAASDTEIEVNAGCSAP